jgi:hypothetical protein
MGWTVSVEISPERWLFEGSIEMTLAVQGIDMHHGEARRHTYQQTGRRDQVQALHLKKSNDQDKLIFYKRRESVSCRIGLLEQWLGGKLW